MERRIAWRAPAWAGVLLLVSVSPGWAQAFEAVGTRALGMGGAFVAVADDATAPYWNPAGLVSGSFFSVVVDRQDADTIRDRGRTDRAGVDRSATFVSLTTPTLGFSYYRLRAVSFEREPGPAENPTAVREDPGAETPRLGSLVTRHIAVTLARALGEHLAVGAALKLVSGEAAFESVDGADASSDALFDRAADLGGKSNRVFDLDVGAMAAFERVRLGIVIRNVRAPGFATRRGRRRSLDRQVRAGLALRPAERLTVALDADLTRTETATGRRRNLALGAEQWLGSRVGVRGGFRFSTVEAARPIGAFGVSIALRTSLWVDGQLTRGDREGDRSWGVTGRVSF